MRPESDYVIARRLAEAIAAHSSPRRPWRRVDTVLSLFQIKRLTDAGRDRIARAFFTVGIEADPPPHAMAREATIRLSLNPRGREQIFDAESTAQHLGTHARVIGHLVLRPYGPNAIHDDHAVVFVNGSGAAIRRLEVSSWMSVGPVTSTTSNRTFEDITDNAGIEIERGPGWDDDFLVTFSLTLTLKDGSTISGGASFPPAATIRPKEYVTAIEAEGVVVDVTYREGGPSAERRPPGARLVGMVRPDDREGVAQIVDAIRQGRSRKTR